MDIAVRERLKSGHAQVWLSGEKGLEKILQHLRRHATAIVAHGKQYILTGYKLCMIGAIFLVEAGYSFRLLCNLIAS